LSINSCSRCIFDTSIKGVFLDSEGVCNICRQIEYLEKSYGTGKEKGEILLKNIINRIKKSGKKKRYDCVVGVSGGTDSSYLLLKAVEWGLRPLAVHYDNSWNSSLATENIREITTAVKVDLYTHVVDNKEADSIKLAFLKAGVAEFDADTDIAFVQVLRSAAAKYGIKYILEGHSFQAEGLSPVSQNYFDGGYIEDICNKNGVEKFITFPNMNFNQFMKWVLIYRQKFIRPLWYLAYSKDQAREYLSKLSGWKYYGGHHLENLATSFFHTVWLPQRYGIDFRNLTLAALVRMGTMSRDEALEIYSSPVVPDPELVLYVKTRLGLTDKEYDNLMNGPKRTYLDFKTYKKRFERLRPVFAILAKANLVPMSFYLKYCFPLSNT